MAAHYLLTHSTFLGSLARIEVLGEALVAPSGGAGAPRNSGTGCPFESWRRSCNFAPLETILIHRCHCGRSVATVATREAFAAAAAADH